MQLPHVADSAPKEPFLMGYDTAHLVTYLRLLDVDAEGADWREAVRSIRIYFGAGGATFP